jgi:hypothetical protein
VERAHEGLDLLLPVQIVHVEAERRQRTSQKFRDWPAGVVERPEAILTMCFLSHLHPKI